MSLRPPVANPQTLFRASVRLTCERTLTRIEMHARNLSIQQVMNGSSGISHRFYIRNGAIK